MFDFDAIVIGSGFGGAVTSCRLAEAGYRVLVLERGRRWDPTTFPRKPTDPWVFDHDHARERNGWFDFRVFDDMTVVQGAGVGGGSLVYANISIPAKEETFHAGWPPEITFADLQQYYAKVGQMLDVHPVPETQWPARTHLMKEAAQNFGAPHRFEPLELAVTFDDAWHYGLPDPHNVAHTKTFTNVHGKPQGTCVHLGNCDIGCDVNARNTLDLNYLARAEHKGAEIRPLHLVKGIERYDGGYKVSYDRLLPSGPRDGFTTARIVVLAAGSLGSTELLLRAHDDETLEGLSARLGLGWSSNGDFLTPAFHRNRNVDPTHGPTITAAINFLDHGADGQDVYVEDGGFPSVVEIALRELQDNPPSDPLARLIIESLRPLLREDRLTKHVMPWFAQSRDAADGRLYLRRNKLRLDWDHDASEATIDAVVAMHKRLAELTGGEALPVLTWELGHNLVTPHPLGGCGMGTSAADGVVDHKGEVFGQPNLFVADGAVIPKAIGLNPSRTIAALAERTAELIVAEGR